MSFLKKIKLPKIIIMKNNNLLIVVVIFLFGTLSCYDRKTNNSPIESNMGISIKNKTLDAINEQLNTSENCLICDSNQVFITIEDILKMDRFKNKVVYLDFWGTSCKPCLEEFKYTHALKKKFENTPIEFVYISQYRKKKEWDTYREMKWRMIIEKYNLIGTNILVSDELKHHFVYKNKDRTDPIKLYAVPKYILFNKKGEVVDFNAPRPSSKELLYEKLWNLLDE